jgi:hypothetical protein
MGPQAPRLRGKAVDLPQRRPAGQPHNARVLDARQELPLSRADSEAVAAGRALLGSVPTPGGDGFLRTFGKPPAA